MTSLLVRQLKRYLGLADEDALRPLLEQLRDRAQDDPALTRLTAGLLPLIDAVEDAYQQYDRDVALRARSLDLSSQELYAINQRLAEEVRQRQDALDTLTLTAERLRQDAGLAPLDPSLDRSVPALAEMLAELIQQRAAAEQRLQLAAEVFENANEGITITDASGQIISVNPAFCKITGYAPDEVIGKNPRILSSGRHDRFFYQQMWAEIQTSGRWRGEMWNRRKDGTFFPEWLSISAVRAPTGEIAHYVGVFADITRVKESQEKLAFLAHHDPLTGLPNRILFNIRLEHGIQRAKREQQILSIYFIDLDRFKDVNDTLGHQAGDQLLAMVARRLDGRLRANDTLARLGGDEFILLQENTESTSNVSMVAEKLLAELRRPFKMLEHEIHVGASIGICVYPADGDNAETLVKNADAAMYQAKAHGRNTFHFYTESMTQIAMDRIRLEGQLRGAIEREELELYYQPQFDLTDGRLIGTEALVRWHHPTMGLVAPIRFIPLAEETGFIVALGDWVLRTACAQIADWDKQGITVPRVAVNLSAKQFDHGDLAHAVRDAITAAQIAPARLELELTESVIMECNDAFPVLESLRAEGIAISIDDFGTGYSSLSYLKVLPIDKLKIDRSFVVDIGQDTSDEIIVRAIINLGKSLGLKVLAEGVEEAAQANFLCAEGCMEMQGYLYSRPLPAAEFASRCRTGWDLSPPGCSLRETEPIR
jgi:diguanylate cyclase (GGDEF)-like protein/PAS domain S-box-containing protein